MEAKKIHTAIKNKTTATKNEVDVYSLSGKHIRTEKLLKDIFQKKNNPELIAQYIRIYLHNQRQGTVSAKTRAEVTGTTKKIYRQKGTGRARHGAAKANLFRGGGVTFGPKPRKFSLLLNKKQKKLALFITLSQKAKTKNIRILESNEIGKTPKTKTIVDFLKVTKLNKKKILFVFSQIEKNSFVLSSQNIESVDIMQASTLNPYQILNHDEIIFVDNALKTFNDHFTLKHEN